MNVQEVAGVLAYFGSAWPTMDITDDTADVWALELQDIPAEVAHVAMRNQVQTRDFPATIASFRDECRIVLHRQTVRQNAPAIGAGKGEAMPKELIAELRSMLTAESMRKHNHKTAEPCPVCGSRSGAPLTEARP